MIENLKWMKNKVIRFLCWGIKVFLPTVITPLIILSGYNVLSQKTTILQIFWSLTFSVTAFIVIIFICKSIEKDESGYALYTIFLFFFIVFFLIINFLCNTAFDSLEDKINDYNMGDCDKILNEYQPTVNNEILMDSETYQENKLNKYDEVSKKLCSLQDETEYFKIYSIILILVLGTFLFLYWFVDDGNIEKEIRKKTIGQITKKYFAYIMFIITSCTSLDLLVSRFWGYFSPVVTNSSGIQFGVSKESLEFSNAILLIALCCIFLMMSMLVFSWFVKLIYKEEKQRSKRRKKRKNLKRKSRLILYLFAS